MSKKIELDVTVHEPKPVARARSTEDSLNLAHTGVEFYVHVPHSTAPMMYYMYDSREEADTIADGVGGEVFVRDVSEWRKAP